MRKLQALSLMMMVVVLPLAFVASVRAMDERVMVVQFVMRATVHDSDSRTGASGVFCVTVTGYYRQGYSYFYKVKHTASADLATFHTANIRVIFDSDVYDEENWYYDQTDFYDSYTYDDTPYATRGRSYMAASVYFGPFYIGTVVCEAEVFVPC